MKEFYTDRFYYKKIDSNHEKDMYFSSVYIPNDIMCILGDVSF